MRFWRVFVGLIDAQLAITKTYITEASDTTSVASGFVILSTCWALGLAIAPVLGGFRVHPLTQYPGVAPWDSFFSVNFPMHYPVSLLHVCVLPALV